MTRLVFCICTALILFHPGEDSLKATYRHISTGEIHENTANTVSNENTENKGKSDINEYTVIKEETQSSISKMKALDLIMQRYAANFEKIYKDDTKKEYYYKLPFADYYLVCEGQAGDEQYYLIHLYEFVMDDPDTGVGHTVTYGWYTVDQQTGAITDQTQ